MKKLLAVTLSVLMVLSMSLVGVSAAQTEPSGDTAAEQTQSAEVQTDEAAGETGEEDAEFTSAPEETEPYFSEEQTQAEIEETQQSAEEPSVTEPEPEETARETTEPEETAPETTEPEETQPVTVPENVKIGMGSLTLGVGESASVTAALADGTAEAYIWTSSDNGVVSVTASSKGKASVRANGVGTAELTVTASDGSQDVCAVTVLEAPSATTVNKHELFLGIGESYTLTCSFPYGSYSYGMTYSSLNSSIASVNASTGVITAKATGTVTILAKTFNGKQSKCRVTVKKAPASVSLNKTSLVLGVGETFDLNSSVPSGTASYNSTYYSGNPEIAAVNAAGGLVTAKSVGTATITVKTYNGKKATCKVTVKKAPDSISLSQTKLILGVGEVFDLDSILPAGCASRSTEFTSDKSNIAAVKALGGLITAKAVGTAKITAETYNGKTAVCTVTVKKAPSSVSLNKTSVTLGVGETYDLNASVPEGCASRNSVYSSNKASVATVKAYGGLVTAKAVGTAVITVKTYNGKTATSKVTVKKAPASVSLNKTSLVLGVGEAFDLNSSVPSGTASYYSTYSSDNPGIAAVKAAGGLVTAKSVGTAKVTVKTYNGKTAVCTVTVKKAPDSITINKTSITLGVGETYDLDSILPAGCASRSTEFTSDKSNIASVKALGGIVTAKAVGTAKITAKTYNGKTATCTVTVKKAPASVSLNKTSLILGIGETYDLNSSLPSGCASNNTKYSSGKPSVASVKAAGGLVTAKAVGTTTITAKTYNGKTATCTVTVKKLATSVSMSKSAVTMMVGEVYDLDGVVPDGTAAYYRSYSSDNTKVAAVAAGNGVVTAKAKGTATITVTLKCGPKATCKVTVVDSGAKKTVSVATTLRYEPSWASKTVASVSKGAAVYQYDKTSDGRWLKVKYGSNYGWIYNKAMGVKNNYSVINTTTLPVVADDLLFDLGTSINSIFNYCYNMGYRNASNDTVENLCVYILANGRGACYHHAALLYYLLDRAGYDTLVVNGIDKYTGGGPHAWCMVKTGGNWRHIDPTGIIGLNRFYLVTDSVIAPYFSWDRTKYPAAK